MLSKIRYGQLLESTFFKQGQRELSAYLTREKVDEDIIQKVLHSGYYYFQGRIRDTFYGNKMFSGQLSPERFINYIRTGGYPDQHVKVPIYQVKSLNEARNLLLSDEASARWFSSGKMSFRGQTREHRVTRPFPNPVQSNELGEEALITPSFWRKFKDDLYNRPIDVPRSLFTSSIADELIFHGIDTDKVFSHTIFHISDLEDIDDPICQEYYKRWSKHKIDGVYNPRIPLLEQHYGFDTPGLDVTFDLGTALFFAVNQFSLVENKATYIPVKNGQHKGIIYCFVFRSPYLTKTYDIIKEIGIFEHLSPLRPLRQQCALPFFDAFGINEAKTDLHAVLLIDQHFEGSELPTAQYLFPPVSEDPFYEKLLEQKYKFANTLGYYSEVVEYVNLDKG